MSSPLHSLSEQGRNSLEKTMSPLNIWALAFGAIIGWGAFVMPGLRFLPTAGPLGSCIGFALGGIMLMFVAASYGKIVGMYPVAGGVFAFAYAVFGSTAAFICGWALVLGYVSFIALNATALVLLTRFLMPGVLEFGYLYTIAEWKIHLGELFFLEAVLLVFAYMNYRGATIVAKAQTTMAIVLALGVTALTVGAFSAPTAQLSNLQPLFAEDKSLLAGIAAVVAVAPWLFAGFDTIPQAAEEFNFPPGRALRLMVASIICGIVVYCLVTLAIGVVLPYQELLAQKPAWHAGTTATLSLGKAGSFILAAAVLAAILTGINGFFIGSSRLLFSMGRSRILPVWFSTLHPKHQTPCNAIFFVAIFVVMAPLFGREVLGWVVDMSSLGIIVAYLYACCSAYKVLNNKKDIPDSAFYKIISALGCLSSIVCMALLMIPGSPAAIGKESWIALLIWIGLGIAFYFLRLSDVRGFSERERSFLILGDSTVLEEIRSL